MKAYLRHYGPVALLLAVILVATTLLSLFVGDGTEEDGGIQVLATTYPLYVAAQNVIAGADGEVALTLLSGAGSGCLHDYQLTPADRLALARADVVLSNGLGDESLLEGVPAERLVSTATEVSLLAAACHDHHDHHDHEASYNEHIWLSPSRYAKQVLVVMQTLIDQNPSAAAVYRENATNYLMRVDYVGQQLQGLGLTDRPCVLFHDSLSYLAEDLGLDVKLTLTAEGESGLSAAHLAQVEALVADNPDLILLYDTQYPIRYSAVDNLLPDTQVLALDTAVVGQGNPSDWVDAMTRNWETLKPLTEGGDAP